MALNPQYMIAPSLQEIFVDPSTGLPLAGGTVTFYSDANRSSLKAVYELSGSPGSYTYTQIANPAQLSAGGTLTDGTNDIIPYYYPYNSSGAVELYYIVVKDVNGNIKITRQAYPNFTTSEPPSAPTFAYDFVRNPAFTNWSSSTSYPLIGLGSSSSNLSDFIADDWYYYNNDATQQITISRAAYAGGFGSIPNTNTIYYLQYANANGGVSQNLNQIVQNYQNVQTLQGEAITVSVWLNLISGSSPQSMSVVLNQNFGSGGSTAVPITVININLSGSGWQQFTGTATLPSIASKTIGTGSSLQLMINFPFNNICTIGVGYVQMQKGAQLQIITEKSFDDISRSTNYQTTYPLFYTGDYKLTLATSAPTGWVMCDDGTLGNLVSGANHAGLFTKALYELIWTNVNNVIYTPMYNSSGSPVNFGGSAESDYNVGNRLSLTKMLGRVLSGYNPTPTSIVSKIFTASSSSGLLLTVNDATSFITGDVVQVSNVGGALPTGLSASTNYYVVSASSTTFNLATSLANALLATPTVISYTNAGSGTNTVFTINNSHALGSYLGEDSHALSIPEIPAHSHQPPSGNQFVITGGTAVNAGNNQAYQVQSFTGLTGGSTAHNIIQPTTYVNVMLKL